MLTNNSELLSWFVCAVITICLANERFNGNTSIMFQGITHIFIGLMLGLFFVGLKGIPFGLLGVGLTIVELICVFDK